MTHKKIKTIRSTKMHHTDSSIQPGGMDMLFERGHKGRIEFSIEKMSDL